MNFHILQVILNIKENKCVDLSTCSRMIYLYIMYLLKMHAYLFNNFRQRENTTENTSGQLEQNNIVMSLLATLAIYVNIFKERL